MPGCLRWAALRASRKKRSTSSGLEFGARASSFAEAHYSPGAWARRLEALYEEAIEG